MGRGTFLCVHHIWEFPRHILISNCVPVLSEKLKPASVHVDLCLGRTEAAYMYT